MKKFLTLLFFITIPISGLTNWNKLNLCNTTNNQNQQIDLNQIIKEHNLGNIVMKNTIPSKEELLTAIINTNKKAKILTIDDFIYRDVPTATDCLIIGVGEYTGEILLQYSKQLISLDKIIPNKSLNSIVFSNYMLPSKDDLLTAIKNINPLSINLTIDDFVIIDTPTTKTATIMGINNYTNTITLTYTQQNVKTDINSLIINNDLGAINFSNKMLPSKDDLLTAILNINPTANKLTINDFVVNDTPTTQTATIMGIGIYKGTVILTYSQQNAQVDIEKLITVLNLGKITVIGILPPTKSQLLNGIQAVNPKAKVLTLNNFALLDIPTNTSATIYGIGNNYKGSVTVSYRIL